MISWFCFWHASEGGPDEHDLRGLAALLRGCPGLQAGHVMTPAVAHDPYYVDRSGSARLVLQLEFPEIAPLEDALRRDGPLSALLDPLVLPGLAGAAVTQDAMLTRRYPVADPGPTLAGEARLSYLVEYEGPAADPDEWHRFYMDHHPRLLAKFAGIRRIEIYTGAEFVSGLPVGRRRALQRNKTVWDSPAAMEAAMASPVRDTLRADFRSFPPFHEGGFHHPFRTVSVTGWAA